MRPWRILHAFDRHRPRPTRVHAAGTRAEIFHHTNHTAAPRSVAKTDFMSPLQRLQNMQ